MSWKTIWSVKPKGKMGLPFGKLYGMSLIELQMNDEEKLYRFYGTNGSISMELDENPIFNTYPESLEALVNHQPKENK